MIVWLLDGAQAMKASERAILDEARRAGLPIQFLVNKADRLTPSDLTKVMDLVTFALADARLRSWSPPLALSARLALAGKLGDEAALAASRWPEVQALFDTELVARSDELKERALRRRARAIVDRLVTRATDRAHAEATARETSLHAHGACLLAAAALDRDSGTTVRDVADGLAAAEALWRGEIAVVATGRGRDRGSGDEGGGAGAAIGALAGYRIDRALAHVAPALAAAMKARLVKTGLASASADGAPIDLAAAAGVDGDRLARDLVRVAAVLPASGAPASPDGAATSPWALGLARAAVGAWVERLASPTRADTRARTLAHAAASAAESELSAIAERLGDKPLA